MRNPKILIIGKTVASNVTLKYILQNQDFIVNSTNTSAEGLLAMLSSPPDIIIIDAEEKTNEILRKIEGTMISSSIILICSKNQTVSNENMLHLGIEKQIKKPYHFCDILSAVHSTIYSYFSKTK